MSEPPTTVTYASAADELRTLRDLVRWGASRFGEAELHYGHGTDNALDEALALALSALHLDHALPGDYLDARLTRQERAAVLVLFRRRIDERKPAPYLTHQARFAGLEFYVDERVLVPRSPIAELIEQGFEPWLSGVEIHRVLDLCTGSGCIAIACAYAFPDARVDAVDLSSQALEVARINVGRHGLEERVALIESDLFQAIPGERYDLIVSNPPYVSAREMSELPPEYRFEPSLGLAAGEDGLEVIRRILASAPEHLTPDGILVAEVGNSEAALQQRFPQIPFLWLDFDRGGHGVFLLTASQLAEHRDAFSD
ncbi:MAG: 50S ribosomal protein L3 N(5)-glutamine methyltransferase [Gammaproteobacteria bacterium]